MKFTKKKIPSLRYDGPEWHWCLDGQDFSVIALPGGVFFRGDFEPVDTTEALEELAKVIGLAWNEHLKLKLSLTKKLSTGGRPV